METAKRLLFGFSVLTILVLQFGCSRSQAYRQEREYYQDEDARAVSANRAKGYGLPKKKVFVLPLLNETPVGGEELGIAAAEELNRLIKTTARAVVPEDVRTTAKSQDFYTGKKVRLGMLAQEGRRIGVSLLVIGKIKKIIYRKKGDEVGLFRKRRSIAAVEIETRVFDMAEPREILLDEKTSDSTASQLNILSGGSDEDSKSDRYELVESAVRSGMKMMAADIVRALEKLSWEGRIAKITSGRAIINAGRATGINIGDILKVLTPGEDVYDPATGAYLGKSPGQVKGTLEIVDYLGPDGAIAAVHSGGNFLENDLVQLY